MKAFTQQYKSLNGNNTDAVNENIQNWNIAKWLKARGVDERVLKDFHQINDVVTLLSIRDDLWNRMNESERGVWAGYWGIVYSKGFPLTKKFWKKFEKIVMAIDTRERIMAQNRTRIKALKKNP